MEEDNTLNNPQVRFMARLITVKRCMVRNVPRSDWDDVLQDVYEIMLKYRYLERWDPNRGVTLPAYMSGLINNRISKHLKRNARERRTFQSYDVQNDSGESFSLLDMINDASEVGEAESSLRQDVFEIYEKLVAEFPYATAVVYDNLRYVSPIPKGPSEAFYKDRGFLVWSRSVAMIFYLLYLGWNQTEIAQFLHVSRPWVSRKVGFIRKFKPFLEWAERISGP